MPSEIALRDWLQMSPGRKRAHRDKAESQKSAQLHKLNYRQSALDMEALLGFYSRSHWSEAIQDHPMDLSKSLDPWRRAQGHV